MKLNELKPAKGSTKARTRVGRGIGSGKGKTSGVGQKGQKSRTGVAIKGFEGGQMPLYRRLPKRGFHNPGAKRFAEINLTRLQKAVDDKKLDGKSDVTAEVLRAAGVIDNPYDGVRVLGTGELKAKLTLKVAGATKSATAAIEKAGGKVETGVLSVKAQKEKAKDAAVKGVAKRAKAAKAEKAKKAKKAKK